MNSISHLRILDKDINIITNSLLLKKFIEKGSFFFFPKDKDKVTISLSYIFKNPQDIREILISIVKLQRKIFEGIKDRYWSFHAAAFSHDNQATVVLGGPGSGKSSLCLASGLCGAKIISDEPVLINKKSFFVMPFRYLIKIEGFCQNFSKWNFPFKSDFNQNRFIEKGEFDFNLFAKDDLNKLDIEVEDREILLKNIIFLERKKYDSVIHLSKHCRNREQDLKDCLVSLNNLIRKKEIIFLPHITNRLKNEKKIKDILNNVVRV